MTQPAAREPARPTALVLSRSMAAVALVALVVATAGPVLRTLYPILYVIGEDWSYPGVGAVGLLLYLAPVLAVVLARAHPRTGVLTGTVLMVAAVVALVVASPISRYAAGAATVLALVGATLVLLHLSAAGVPRLVLLTGAVLGIGVDTGLRGMLITWDAVWRTGLLAWLLVLLPVAAVVVGWWATRDDPPVVTTSSARRSAVVGIGGLVALAALFLQNPGYVSALSGWSFTAGVAVVVVAAALALAALLLGTAPGLHRPVPALVLGLVAAVLVALSAVVTGPLSALVVVTAWPAVVLLGALGVASDVVDPTRRHRAAGPLRAAGAAAFGLVVVFLWQFYIDTTLPFPRWALAVVPVAVLALGAFLGARRPAPAAQPRRPVLVSALAALAVGALAVGSLVVTAPAAAVATGTDRTVTVMTYNIRSAADVDGQIRPDVVADVVRSFDPDVLVLQETGRGWAIHAGTDVVSVLERELGYQAAFMGSADDSFGNVVLSRLPFEVTSSGYLPDAGGQRRSYIAVTVDVAGTPLLVVNGHLQDRSIPQIDALLGVAGSTRPAVVLGDFNTWPDLPEAQAFTATGLVDVVAATGDRCRTTSAQPTRPCDRPDWILVTPDMRIDDVDIGTVPASDHLPIVATLTLP